MYASPVRMVSVAKRRANLNGKLSIPFHAQSQGMFSFFHQNLRCSKPRVTNIFKTCVLT